MNKKYKNEQQSVRKNYEYVSSDENDDKDEYQDVLMKSLMAMSNTHSQISPTQRLKPTESRIEFVKNILDCCEILKPMVNFNECNTETATSPRLNKRVIDIRNLLNSMNVKLKYLKSGTTGHTFKAISKINKNVAFAVKVCAYPKDEYGGMNNLKRPENAELRILKLLSYFVVNGISPHFVLPIGTFNTSITNFIKIPKKMIDLDDEKNEMYRKFIERYNNDEFEPLVSVLISEWCSGGDLLDYIRKNYKQMILKEWIVIFFQILFTLSLVQDKYPAFRHNDMKANNILVNIVETSPKQTNRKYRYNIDDWKFLIPDIGIQTKIWDFDFACIGGLIENNKVNAKWTGKLNISNVQNRYYDMHYFFNTLISKRFFPQFYNGGAPVEIVEFIHRVVPSHLRNGSNKVNDKGRILVNTEYTTPYEVIVTDPLFEKYRFKKNDFNDM